MRIKQLWDVIALPSKLKVAVCSRLERRAGLLTPTTPSVLSCDVQPPDHRLLPTIIAAVYPSEWLSWLVGLAPPFVHSPDQGSCFESPGH